MILGIDTSCDDTSFALVENNQLIAETTATQEIHQPYGGVIPEWAARAHLKAVNQLYSQLMQKKPVNSNPVSAIGVTTGPGLIGSLITGINFAKGLSSALKLPVYGVHHLEGHLLIPFLGREIPAEPWLGMVISGGHTLMVYVPEPGSYQQLGTTRDDAVGESFDKVAQMLNLPYPGGPSIESAATDGDPEFYRFPRALQQKDSFEFSFSGLKTAVLYYIQNKGEDFTRSNINHICASFQEAVFDIILKKLDNALKKYKCRILSLGGGVIANQEFRRQLTVFCEKSGVSLFLPGKGLSTDNGVMIAQSLDYRLKNKLPVSADLTPRSTWNIRNFPA